jgi:DinB family protein
MKPLLAFCLLAAPVVTPVLAQTGGKLNDAERTYLIEQLELSKKNMLASISGLTDAQWRFKPAPAVWSVAECAEHLVLAEDFLFSSTQDILKSPAVERPASSNPQTDHMLVAGVLDRSKKATAPEPITPAGGKFATPGEAAREFTLRRDKTIAYVKATQDDLRIHTAPGPLGPMDAYQFLLLIASHAGRHTLQIKEVEANPGYPKASAKVVFE